MILPFDTEARRREAFRLRAVQRKLELQQQLFKIQKAELEIAQGMEELQWLEAELELSPKR